MGFVGFIYGLLKGGMFGVGSRLGCDCFKLLDKVGGVL